MGRNKIAIAHIKSDASRAVTYSKRKKGLLKKVKELSVLCGVEVCLMCHPQVGASLTWGTPGVGAVIARYKSVASEEREKRKLDNTTLLHQTIQKIAADFHHLVDQNQKLAKNLEDPLWDHRLNSYGFGELKEIAHQIFLKKKEVSERLALISSQREQTFALNQDHMTSVLQQSSPFNQKENAADCQVDFCFTDESSSMLQEHGDTQRNAFQYLTSSLPFGCSQDVSAEALGLQPAYNPVLSNFLGLQPLRGMCPTVGPCNVTSGCNDLDPGSLPFDRQREPLSASIPSMFPGHQILDCVALSQQPTPNSSDSDTLQLAVSRGVDCNYIPQDVAWYGPNSEQHTPDANLGNIYVSRGVQFPIELQDSWQDCFSSSSAGPQLGGQQHQLLQSDAIYTVAFPSMREPGC